LINQTKSYKSLYSNLTLLLVASKYISIKEAADLTDKSPQTIRRLIKSKKIDCRKYKTPQGFNYEVGKESIVEFYNLEASAAAVAEQPIEAKTEVKEVQQLLKDRDHKIIVEYAPVKEFNNTLQMLLKQHAQEKENLFKLVEAFQNKVVSLETKMKVADSESSRWYKFW